MTVEDLRRAGTWHVSREVLKMVVNTGDNWSAQCLRVAGNTESGPAALRGFCLLKSLLTSLSSMERAVTVVVGRPLGWGGAVQESPIVFLNLQWNSFRSLAIWESLTVWGALGL